jgi:hypothetical protein
MRTVGCRSHTPSQITLMAASIISTVWETMCLAPRFSKRSTPACGMPPLAPSWRPMATSRSSTARQKTS